MSESHATRAKREDNAPIVNQEEMEHLQVMP